MCAQRNSEQFINRLLFFGSLIGLYFTSWVHYLLFHSLAEIFSIIVAATIFVIAINSHTYQANRYLLFIGIGYLFIGILDLLHTLSYKGMNIFTDYDYYANQLWIATRYLESLTLLAGIIFLKRPKWFRTSPVCWAYIAITTLIILAIFVCKNFPVCFIAGTGLTPFKKDSEYLISLILLTTIYLLYRNRQEFEEKVFRYIIWALVMTIGSELAFTFYISNYGFSNLVGHYLKIISFFLVYKAIVETGIRQPYDLVFSELKRREEQLRRLSSIDPLTQLKNRRGFLEYFEHSKRRSDDRVVKDHALIMGDIDCFKQINDTYGHACGDQVLQTVARILHDHIRAQDIISRWGGEEFLIMLPECPLEEACRIAEKLRHEVEREQFTYQERPVPLTISFGVTRYHSTTAIESALSEVDQHLYQAKDQGKNCVVCANS